MQTQHTHELLTSYCRFCSLVPKANGKDPIGAVDTCDY